MPSETKRPHTVVGKKSPSGSQVSGEVFGTIKSTKGGSFRVMDRKAFESAAGKADRVIDKIVSGYGTRK